jgi:hypothetical protein
VEAGASLTEEAEARQPTYLNKDTNNLVYFRTLKPKAKTTVTFRYSVEW